jgi:hypothetical protein
VRNERNVMEAATWVWRPHRDQSFPTRGFQSEVIRTER